VAINFDYHQIVETETGIIPLKKANNYARGLYAKGT